MITFLTSGMALFALTIASNFAIDTIFVREAFYLAKRRVRKRDMLLGGFLISLVVVLPILIAYVLMPDMSPTLYSFLFFPPPLAVFVYYPILKYVCKAPRGMIMMGIEWVIMSQYGALIVFLLLTSLLAGILPEPLHWNGLFLPDYPALVLIVVFCWAVYRLLRWILSRTQHFYEVPYSYAPRSTFMGLMDIFLMAMGTYIMLVCSRLVFWETTAYQLAFSPWSVLLYLLLIGLQVYTVTDRYHKNRRIMIEWRAKQTDLYIQSLLQATSEFRQIKHDFSNILQTYGGYISIADYDGLRRYHRTLTQATVDASENLEMVQSLRARPPIHALFVIKKGLAQQRGVRLDVQRIDALADASMPDFDLCRVLGNLLDNAIHAAAESQAKSVRVSAERRGGEVAVVIANSVSGPVDVARIFEEGYSTKQAHSGMGLGSVMRILKHYGGSDIRMENTEEGVMVVLGLEAA